jgi:hypothetical protein
MQSKAGAVCFSLILTDCEGKKLRRRLFLKISLVHESLRGSEYALPEQNLKQTRNTILNPLKIRGYLYTTFEHEY